MFSPLYRLNKDGLEKAEFEIVVWLTGNSSDNGAFIQIRFRYLNIHVYIIIFNINFI